MRPRPSRLLLLPLLLAAGLISACTDATGGSGATSSAPVETPSPTAAPTVGSAGIFELTEGVCLADPVVSGAADSVELVPCESPHRAEVYAVIEVPGDEYPGDEDLARVAENACYQEFAAFVAVPLEHSVHDYTFLYPTAESWEETDDREVTCIATSPEDRTGSLAGLAE